MTKTKVTIKTVAEDAGVSVAAVSKVIRNAYGVSDGLREKVQRSIDKLNYRPSTAARAMRGKTYSIGVLIYGIDNPFILEMLDGVLEHLSGVNYKHFISTGKGKSSLEVELVDTMIDSRVDGLIMIAPRLTPDELAAYGKKIPLVVVGHHEADSRVFDTINSDDFHGAALATETLINAGHKNIHMIAARGASSAWDVCKFRQSGYRYAMESHGLEDQIHVQEISETPLQMPIDINNYLNSLQEPTAVFCWSDLHAIPVFNACTEKGINIPDQLSIIGYDNTPFAKLPMVSLSSVEQDGFGQGLKAAEILLSRIGGRKTPEHILISSTVVERKSSKIKQNIS